MLIKEWNILADLNINIHQNGSILEEENKNVIKDADKVSSETKQYLEFCKTFGLKQLIKSPTRVMPNTSNLMDHILTNTNEKSTQCGLVNVELCDHQMIFCTRKIQPEKVGGHKRISFRSFKNYLVDEFKKTLGKVTFPNSERYNDIKRHTTTFFKNWLS